MEAQGIRTAQLRIGDQIEAWHRGRLFHKGRVTDVVPALELFWILDARTGARKLLDPEALEIRHVDPPVKLEVSAKPQPPAKPLATA
ncbi:MULTISPECIES: hypothetical protein [Micrococcaceae]|jgi:hypothetical protein|uniref:Uncharacterized protein n=1 Tax=Pseudarthrobacter defluvii TaxID=410837 RepID=A0ABT9UEV3_9MICC|nr:MULTISPECIES: hypothetical protein [Micrococcaceae]MDE8586028.1 hypothetical protein [Arthrobacter sp. NQ4]MDQ0118173.1 hypothetical protein [Pseudarthrobacter defluvii]BCW79913.1 hypothetical protein NicSoilC5_19320 [Arthrobacter sp. NicSoilC5]